MLGTIVVPLATVTTETTIDLATPAAVVVHADNGKGGNHSGKPSKNSSSKKKSSKHKKGKGGKNKNSASGSSTASDKGQSSTDEQGNIMDKPAADLGSQAAKDLVDPDGDKNYTTAQKKNDKTGKAIDKSNKGKGKNKGKDSNSQKASIYNTALGDKGAYRIGNAWSFMSSDNGAFWSKDVQGNAAFDVSAQNDKSMSHYPSNYGKRAYASMQDASHLPYIMNQLGLDRSFSQGFNGQKHDMLTSAGAGLMELAYGVTKLVNQGFSYVLNLLNNWNPFNIFVKGRLSSDQQHFGPLDRLIYDLYDASTSFGKVMMVIIFGIGISLAAMGIQVGQNAKTTQGKGMLAAGIDIVKRAFIILVLPLVLATCYSELLSLTTNLFNDAGFAPGNYAVYSTMTSFEDMVTHGRLNFDKKFLDAGLLPNQEGTIDNARVTNAYLNHRSTLSINADFNRSGAADLQAATDGSDYSATSKIFTADMGNSQGKASATNMLKDYVSNKTFSAADYVSQVMPGIPSKGKDDDKSDQKKNVDSTDGSDLTDLESLHYSNNGVLEATPTKIIAAQTSGGMTGATEAGNSTKSNAESLARDGGGLSTIGMYNYLRSVTNGSSIDESSPYKRNNQVSNPQHFSVNFVGSKMVATCNVIFGLSVMGVMAMISLGTLWFVLKALLDSIPGSISGVIQGALGSLAGGARAVGALLGFFISIIVTGAFYQLSFRMIVGFIGSFESFFGANNGQGSGDVLTNGAIHLLGYNGSAPTQVVGLISLNAGTFAGVCLIESGIMIYLLYKFFYWRKTLISSLSAMVNSAFSRIMQSFGSLTGKGSYGMANSGMDEIAQRSGNSGISNLYNGAKSLYGMGNKGVRAVTGGKHSLSSILSTGAKAGAAGMAMKGLASALDNKGGNKSIGGKNNSNKSLKNSNHSNHHSKSGDHKNEQNNLPKSAEDARQNEALQELADRQGDPLNAMDTSGNGNSLKDDAAEKRNQDPMEAMDQGYSDQGQMQQLAAQQGNAMSPTSNKNHMQSLAHQSANQRNGISNNMNQRQSPQDALSQVLAASGIQDPMLQKNSAGAHQFQPGSSRQGMGMQAQPRPQVNANGGSMVGNSINNAHKLNDAHRNDMAQGRGQQKRQGSLPGQSVDGALSPADQVAYQSGLDPSGQPLDSLDNQSDMMNPYQNGMSPEQQQQNLMDGQNQMQDDGQSQDPMSDSAMQQNPMMAANGQMQIQQGQRVIRQQQTQGSRGTVSPTAQQQNVMGQIDPMSTGQNPTLSQDAMSTSQPYMQTDAQQQNVMGQGNSQPMTSTEGKEIAGAVNKTLGTNLSGQEVQQMAPLVGEAASSIPNALGDVLDGGTQTINSGVDGAGMNGATTITATGNGQAVVSQGGGSTVVSTSPGLNNAVAYGRGPGVMPGDVPIGMSVDPGYTSSGAGVIHSGLSTAMGNVQNASTRVVQANNAVKANPTNTILQQRASQALQSQQQAQVQAMRIFNQTPALQTMSSLVNANTPSQISTGQVNQAVSDVYASQQNFKQAATKFGPQSPQTQAAAQNYQKALQTARQVHIKSAILQQPQYLHQAYQEVRKQQMSIMDGTFKL